MPNGGSPSGADGGNPSGAIASALNSIFGVQGTAINTISNLIGVIGPIGSIISTPAGVISTVLGWINSGKPDEIQSAVATIQDTLNNDFAQLDQEVAGLKAVIIAGQISNRNTILHGYVSPAQTQLQQLKGFINSNPTPEQIVDYIGPCITTLNDFSWSDDDVWNTPAGTWIYWTDSGRYQGQCFRHSAAGWSPYSGDVGYGTLAPPQSGDFVFSPVNSMALYMQAVWIFLSVGMASDPNFVVNHQDVLRSCAAMLQQKHDLIMGSGFTLLSPPNWVSRGGIRQSACPGQPPLRGGGLRIIYDVEPDRPLPPPEVAALIEYGAVEKFSGYSSVGDSYEIQLSDPAANSNSAIFNKLQIRLQKRAKDAYGAVGLSSFWAVTNQLKKLVGDAPLPGLNFADWSFREILGLAQLPPTSAGQSLRQLGLFIIDTQPFDTAYSPGVRSFSFRSLLTNFSD